MDSTHALLACRSALGVTRFLIARCNFGSKTQDASAHIHQLRTRTLMPAYLTEWHQAGCALGHRPWDSSLKEPGLHLWSPSSIDIGLAENRFMAKGKKKTLKIAQRNLLEYILLVLSLQSQATFPWCFCVCLWQKCRGFNTKGKDVDD